MSIKTVKLNRFDGGITNDARSKVPNTAKIITNGEVLKNPYRLTPFPSAEDGNANSTADLMRNWLIAYDGTAQRLFGLARQDAADRVRILKKALTTGAATDLDDNGWTESTNNTASQNTPAYNLFVYYKKTGYIYGAHTGTHIWRDDPDGGDAFVDTHQALTYSFIGQGVVHTKDDILYIPYYNAGGFIATNNNGTWNTTALTLPANMQPISICEYGNYLAIGCANTDGVSGSKVYIWDRDSSLATLAESYDLPDGTLAILEWLEGTLVAVLQTSGSSTNGATVNASVRFKDNILFQVLTPSGFKTRMTLEGTTATQLLINKQKLNSRLYFMMGITLHGAYREGVWSFGLNDAGQWTLIHERTPNNDTATSSNPLRGFFYCGDYLFQAFVNASSNHTVTKTTDGDTYSATTIYESTINPNMPEEDLYKLKQLKSVAVRYVALPSAGQVVLKQRTDSTTAWASVTAAFTETTDSARVTEIVAGASQFTAGRELEFRIESTGGAEILELVYTYETMETNA